MPISEIWNIRDAGEQSVSGVKVADLELVFDQIDRLLWESARADSCESAAPCKSDTPARVGSFARRAEAPGPSLPDLTAPGVAGRSPPALSGGKAPGAIDPRGGKP